MAFKSSRKEMTLTDCVPDFMTPTTFPLDTQLSTPDQVCGFELLRLAFFALKLRKLEQRYASDSAVEGIHEYAFRCNLLQHVIFQQIIRLSDLGARDQAMLIIETCRR